MKLSPELLGDDRLQTWYIQDSLGKKWIDTACWLTALPVRKYNSLIKKGVISQFDHTDEVTHAIEWCAEASDYVITQVATLDGGVTTSMELSLRFVYDPADLICPVASLASTRWPILIL